MRILTVIALSAALAFSALGTAKAQDGEIDCPFRVAAPEVEGETTICGRIMVPQDWSELEGTQIRITYVVLKSTSLAPLPDPVIDFQGGPGGATLNSLGLISSGTEPLRASRDVILFDQHGTGFSSELFCPADAMVTDVEAYDDADGEIAAA